MEHSWLTFARERQTKMEHKTGTLEGSEYTMSFIPFETQKRKPKQKAEFAESSAHFYNETTSRSDYREWQTRAIQHGKKQEHRPFNAKFDYNSTYGSDFDSKVRACMRACRRVPFAQHTPSRHWQQASNQPTNQLTDLCDRNRACASPTSSLSSLRM